VVGGEGEGFGLAYVEPVLGGVLIAADGIMG
jgi:hypothetical protein